MDAYLGGELYHLLKAGPLPEDNAKFCSASVLEALDYLHIRAIAYRDMKPENLMIDHTLVFMNSLDRDSKVLNIIQYVFVSNVFCKLCACARVGAHTRKKFVHSCKMSAHTKRKRQRTKILKNCSCVFQSVAQQRNHELSYDRKCFIFITSIFV